MKNISKITPPHILILIIYTLLFLPLATKAQSTDSVRLAINHILAPLNKTIIPTGILAENTYPLFDLSTYNGQQNAENTMDFAQMRLLYSQALSGAYVAPVGLPNITQLNTDYNAVSNNGRDNVVSIALINYASIRTTALTDNQMTALNGQLFDGIAALAKESGNIRVPKSPYQVNSLFAAAGSNNFANNGVYSLTFKPSLFYTNTGLTINNLEVDFGNGNGFVTATFNNTISGTYTSIGNKQLIYKITFSDGTVAQCYNTIFVENIPSITTAARYAPANINANGKEIPDVVINSPTNEHSGVDLFIRRSITNTTGSNAAPQFLKPLIIVEGLDLSDAASLFGKGYNYNSFRKEIIDEPNTNFISGTNPLKPFDEYLDDIGHYDLIFVNWHNGVDDILRNAKALKDVINYVNTNKQATAQQNVVLGISMGGLVSRYCLADMVKSGVNSQTRLLITHDSPHQGANVPLALQHLVQAVRKEKVKAFLGAYSQRLDEIVPKLLDINTAINSPAATQQLLARVVDEAGNLSYNTFLNTTYRNMIDLTGYTQPYRFVATSNGSQCGVQVAAPYSQLASVDADGSAYLLGLRLFTNGRIFLNMKSLPNIGQTDKILDFKLKLKIKYLVFNLLKVSMDIQKYAPGNLLPLDGFAGGTRALGNAFDQPIPINSIPAGSGFANWLHIGVGYNYSYSTPFIAPEFSFVPTTSALDITNFSAVNSTYSVPQTGLNGSRAANYIAQEKINLTSGLTDNVNHTNFYARTCRWLYEEMENITPTYSCIDYCSNSNQLGNIIGPRIVCNNANYTYTGVVPAGSTVTWSANTPNGGANPVFTFSSSGNGSQVTVTNLHYYGSTTNLVATINSPGCSYVGGG